MSYAFPRMTRVIKATDSGVAEAAATLRAGGLVAMPTETVYGLAGLATLDTSVAAIYAAKGRPSFNPLIAHVADFEAAEAEVEFNANARKLAKAFWPGPLTIVAPAPRTRVSLLARAGLDTLALRMPSHEVARALIRSAGAPLVAPSANLSGRVSPTTAQHVFEDLDGRVDVILDAGPTRHGLESTIVACLEGGVRLLRPGAVERERLEAILGQKLVGAGQGDAPIAPGMLASHYAPRARLRLDAVSVGAGEAALDFAGQLAGSGATLRLDLSASGDLVEAASNLFAYLRRLDAAGIERIAAAPVAHHGLGVAINDRLARAAAPRSE